MVLDNTRAFKIEWFRTKVKAVMNAGGVVSFEKLIADFCLFFSTARRTAVEILNQLIVSTEFIRRGDEIWTQAGLDADRIMKNIESLKQPAPANAIEVTK